MTTSKPALLDAAGIDAAVRANHPDYTAVLIGVQNLIPGPSTKESDALLALAEAKAQSFLAGREPHELQEMQAWREAFLSFGVKPREARSSVEALLRRVTSGLPRIDRLTDVYNAVSVMRVVPIGGEDFDCYQGPARLVVATGDETFDTVVDGQPAVGNAEPGEIIWRDDIGATCRRWNWRQCVRTRLTDATTDALFIIDGLGPDSQSRTESAADELIERLAKASPSAIFTARTIAGSSRGSAPCRSSHGATTSSSASTPPPSSPAPNGHDANPAASTTSAP